MLIYGWVTILNTFRPFWPSDSTLSDRSTSPTTKHRYRGTKAVESSKNELEPKLCSSNLLWKKASEERRSFSQSYF